MKEQILKVLIDYLLKDESTELTVLNESNNISDSFIGKYVIIRTRDAGVHVGYLKKYQNRECILTESRRLWYWEGSFTLNGVANKGFKTAKMPLAVDEILILEIAEIIPCTEKAKKQLIGWEVYYDK